MNHARNRLRNMPHRAAAAFKAGKEDARIGAMHKRDQGKHYSAGYAFQYTVDQRREARGKHA